MKAVLFDLDGVLIDTEGIYSNFWATTGRDFGVEDPEFAHKIKGTTLAQILDRNFPKEMHQRIIDVLVDFEHNMRYEIFPGAMELLQELRDRHIPTAIVTSSGDQKMQRLWEQHPGFRDYFTAVITDADVTRSKPDPQPYLVAAERLGIAPEDCYVIEDSFTGVESGRRAGAKVIAIATTNPASSLEGKADLVLPSIADLTADRLLSV
ncbi:MAG: HAD family phosphatase [Bacteroidales bacterium]|nr:HAD family phosphatase [Bacteroidales bacterium]